MRKKETKIQNESETVEVQRRTKELLDAHGEALSLFDSLPAGLDGSKDWEKVLVGPEADFPTHVEGMDVQEINETEIVEQSENGSVFFRVIRGVFRKK